MKTLNLTQGKTTLVSSRDYAHLRQFKWCAHWNGHHWYATNQVLGRLHRYLLAPVPAGYVVDHKNRDSLDNQRSNLRLATLSQNIVNSLVCKRNRLGIKGVFRRRNSYVAKINGLWLGSFPTLKAAKATRNRFVKALHKSFAVT